MEQSIQNPPRAMDVLIIEDELLDAMVLQDLLEELGHTVVGIARTHKEAVALAKAKQPSLVMGTVILADGHTGIAAVEDILQVMRVPVVFVTAMPEDHVKVRREAPTFIVTKPAKSETVASAILAALRYESDLGQKIRN